MNIFFSSILIKRVFKEIAKYRFVSLINLFGITIGMIVCLFIFIYVKYELSFDRFFKGHENIYRLTGAYQDKNGEKELWAMIPPAFGPAIKTTFPEIIDAVRVLKSITYSIGNEENSFRSESIIFVDSSFFKIFSYPLKLGDRNTALNNNDEIILTSSTAKKLFGKEDPLNKPVKLFSKRGEINCVVTGVLDEFSTNSHLKFEAIVAYPAVVRLRGKHIDDSWTFSRVYTYLKTKNETDPQSIIAKFPEFIKTYCPENVNYFSLDLLNLKDIHLYSHMEFDTDNSNAKNVYWLLIIGIIVLIMAWINYINLSTSNVINRLKVNGISKILGAKQRHIVFHHIMVAFVINLLALLLAIISIFLVTPFINRLTGLNIFQQDGISWFLILTSISLIIINSLVTGLIPTFLSFTTKSEIITSSKHSKAVASLSIRRPLIVIQYSMAIVLLVGTIVVLRQFRYMDKKDLGFDIKDKLILSAPVQYSSQADDYEKAVRVFKDEVQQIPGVKFITSSYVIPGMRVPWIYISREINRDRIDVGANINLIDFDFIENYNIELIAGRSFSRNIKKDKNAVLLNKRAATLLGFTNPESALGETILEGDTEREIIGILDNFHQESLNKNYQPFVFLFEEIGRYYYTVGISEEIFQSSKSKLSALWNKHFPGDMFDHWFLDDFFQEQYKDDYLFGQIFTVFCIISLLIASLGIYGMSIAMAENRIKEIGIRKINGAKISEVIILLNKDFVKWIIIAFIIATPISRFVMTKWLEKFAYKTNLSWWIFAFAGVLAFGIALLTVNWQSWQVARSNPVEALRYE